MKKMILGISLLAIFVSFQGIASAKEISGTVAGIDTVTNKLTVSYTNPENQAVEKADILVKPETSYNGVASFADLKEGQAVTVDASEDAAGGWVAAAIKASEAKMAEAPKAQQPAAQQ